MRFFHAQRVPCFSYRRKVQYDLGSWKILSHASRKPSTASAWVSAAAFAASATIFAAAASFFRGRRSLFLATGEKTPDCLPERHDARYDPCHDSTRSKGFRDASESPL